MKSPIPATCFRCGSVDLITVRCDSGPHYARVNCNACATAGRFSFLRWEPAPMTPERAAAWIMPFGMFAGESLAQIGVTERGRSYLHWLVDHLDLSNSARRAITCHLETIER